MSTFIALQIAFSTISLTFAAPSGFKNKSKQIQIEKNDLRPDRKAPFNFEFSGEGEIGIENKKHIEKNQDSVAFYQFRLKPWVERKKNVDIPTIEIEGAFIGFRYDESALAAELMVATGIQKEQKGNRLSRETFDWYGTSVYLAYNEDGSIASQTPVMVRLDYDNRSWDLYLYDKLRITDLPLIRETGEFRIKTVGKGRTSIAGLRIGDANPLFNDEDFDGIDDQFAAQYPGLKRNDIIESTGSSLLVEYLSRDPKTFYKKKTGRNPQNK